MNTTEKNNINNSQVNGHRVPVMMEDESPQQFAMRLKNTVTSGLQALALSIAVQHGVFEVMDSPKTSYEIAQAAGLKERYVRELLHSFVVGRIIEMNVEKETYYIPPQRRPLLTGQHNVAALSCLLPTLADGYQHVSECFKIDGPKGVSYDQYPMFQAFMDHMSCVMHSQTLLSDFVPAVPGLEKQLETGITVLDIGCGRARVPLMLAKRFQKSYFYGIDISADAIKYAQDESDRMGLNNTSFLAHDAASLPEEWSQKFDYVTALDCIHDQASPDTVLSEANRVLKSRGVFSMVELAVSSNPVQNIGNPRAQHGYVISLFHCMPVSLYFDGKGLGTMWGKEDAMKMLEEAGLSVVKVHKAKDMFNFHYICKKEVGGR
ncbi:S-adenosylmethionine-dependent methyltransferase Rv2258c-like [Glandiceps talaboti]